MHKTRSDRRLIAILMADMAGYSRLVGVDEVDTVQRLDGVFRDVIEPRVQEHMGRIVKRMGDGVLCAFDSVVEALNAALAIQHSLAEEGAAQPETKRICFRIGINLGDVITDGGDILGEGVNIAARLEALAEPGGICISGSAYQQVSIRVDLGAQAVVHFERGSSRLVHADVIFETDATRRRDRRAYGCSTGNVRKDMFMRLWRKPCCRKNQDLSPSVNA